jgi:hypothetical protein
MAKTIDTDRLMSDCGQEIPQSGNDDVDGFMQIHIVNRRVSANGRYLIITEERVIDILALDRLTQIDQFKQLSLYVYTIFASYLDHKLRDDFCLQVFKMFMNGIIEIITNPECGGIINFPMNKGQAELVRLIISHMTQQKLAAIQDKTAFNDLKHLLMEHLRKQCQPIPVNSMSKTLLRAVEQVVKGLPVNI